MPGPKRRSLVERFMEFVMPEPMSGCWLWTGDCYSVGYGRISLGGHQGPQVGAHRVAYELFCGPIPSGFHVCHKCDIRICVNPDHLFVGTNQDNIKDRVSKGRSGHGGSHLSENDVIAIRADLRPHRLIASEYELSRSAISLIKTRVRWKHVTEKEPEHGKY